jgi:MFS family permease
VLLVWGSGLFSDVGTWVQLIVVGSLVAKNTGSALYTGLTALALFTPQGVCAPIGGLLADRYDRRKVFAGALCLQGGATAVLAIVLAAGVRQPLILSAIIVFSSTGGALGQPAYQAMLPDLVPPEELMAMVALSIYSWNGGRIIGPVLGTILVATVGAAWTVGFNAATFVAMAIAVSLLRRSFLPPHAGRTEGIIERLRDGVRATRAVAGCRYSIMIVMILNLAVAPFMGLIPIYVREAFHGGTGLTGTFSALQGGGAIAGGLLFTVLAHRFGRGQMVLLAMSWLITAFALYALAPTAVFAGVVVACMGAGSASVFTACLSVIQRDAPAAERGRILSIMHAANGFFYGIGVLWISVLGDWIDLRTAFLASAGLAMALLGAFAFTAPSWRSVFDDTRHPVESTEPALA